MKMNETALLTADEFSGTKDELIEHWMGIVACVFQAEDKLRDEWAPRLKEALHLSPDERVELCDDYLRAIAEEILSKTDQEELQDD